MSPRTSSTEPDPATVFEDPNARLARELGDHLLREITAYQQQLEHLLGQEGASQRQPLETCRDAIRIRRAMLDDLSAATGGRSGRDAPSAATVLRDRPLRA